jgi:hypothetical protein
MPSCAAYRGGCSSEVRTGLRPPVLRGFRRCRGARHPSALKGGISGGGCCGGNTPEPLAAALDGPIRSSGGELSGAPFSCAANNRTNRLKFSRCCETGRGRERRLSLAASRKGGGGMTHAPRGESVFGATDRGSSGPQIPGFSRLKKFGLLYHLIWTSRRPEPCQLGSAAYPRSDTVSMQLDAVKARSPSNPAKRPSEIAPPGSVWPARHSRPFRKVQTETRPAGRTTPEGRIIFGIYRRTDVGEYQEV